MAVEETMFGILMRTTIENFWPLSKPGKGKTSRVFFRDECRSNEIEEIESEEK